MGRNSGVVTPEYVAPFFRFQSFSELLRKFNIFKNHAFSDFFPIYRSIGLLFANNLSPWLLFLVTCTDIYGFLCHYSQLFRNYFAIIRNYSQLFAI
jgi:hypothetical protein